MAEPFVTIATFATIVEAELARNRLDEEGLHAFLADTETVGMLWHMGGALGGIKLQVAAEDEPRARSILHRRREWPDEPSTDDYGLDSVPATSIKRARSFTSPAKDEDEDEDDVPESRADITARRAWRSAVIGLLVFPPLLHFYSVGLLLQLLGADDPLSDKGKRVVCAAIAFDVLGFAFGVGMWRLFWLAF